MKTLTITEGWYGNSKADCVWLYDELTDSYKYILKNDPEFLELLQKEVSAYRFNGYEINNESGYDLGTGIHDKFDIMVEMVKGWLIDDRLRAMTMKPKDNLFIRQYINDAFDHYVKWYKLTEQQIEVLADYVSELHSK